MTYKNAKKWSAERRGDAFIVPEISTSSEHPELLHNILAGDCREILPSLPAHSIDLSLWSPPYYVGKSYEEGWSFDDWQELLEDVITLHSAIIKPGGFLVVNIGDILCFADPDMPRFQANNVSRKKCAVTLRHVLEAKASYPEFSRHQLAELLGCSEQTIQRRLEGNNIRGGKHSVQTRIMRTGNMICGWAEDAGFYLYDQRIWHKDPCWTSCRWHSNSYRAVDEFEHLYVFWQPGITDYDRNRLKPHEWSEWGSRGVWNIPSVRRHDRHEAEFPEELVSRVIRLFSHKGGMVLDPFVGSGTTAVAAAKLGRSCIGIELNADYAEAAVLRLNSEVACL